MTITLNQASRILDVPIQNLHYHYLRGRISGNYTGTVVLVDPEVTRRELEAAGFFRRRELKKRNREAREARGK